VLPQSGKKGGQEKKQRKRWKKGVRGSIWEKKQLKWAEKKKKGGGKGKKKKKKSG